MRGRYCASAIVACKKIAAATGTWRLAGRALQAFAIFTLPLALLDLLSAFSPFQRRSCADAAWYVTAPETAMKRTWTIIGVTDVAASLEWYQSLFGQPHTPPAHSYFGQLLDSDGTVLLCLHEWGAHDHPSLFSPDRATPGNGLLLFFRVDDSDLALERARKLVPSLEEEPHLNPNTGTSEFSLRDPDGYYVTMSAL